MVALDFTFDTDPTSFALLAHQLRGAIREPDEIIMDQNEWNGSLQRVQLEEELTIFDWHIRFREDVTFIKNISTHHSEKRYLLKYSYQPGSETLDILDSRPVSYNNVAPSLIVFSNRFQTRWTFRAGSELQWLAVLFSHNWLLQQLKVIGSEQMVTEHLLRFLDQVLIRNLSLSEIGLSTELSKEIRSRTVSLVIKAQVYSLLSLLYRQVSYKINKDHQWEKYKDMLLATEKDLMANLCTPMPAIETLAKRYFVSPSTLSRHFKKAYGMTMQDYYIEKKMELARDLVAQGHSVNEVALKLGYENASHFISTFKRVFGLSPGKIKISERS